MHSCGLLALRVGVRSARSIFGGSGDQETFFFDLGVSSIKIDVMIGDAGKEKFLPGEETRERGFSGELGAVSNTSSLLASDSPEGSDGEAML
jgi:hypothetical protein